MADVDVATTGGIATVTLNRAATRNSVTLAMWKDLGTIFRDLGRDQGVRGIMLTGAGGNFSVGADVSEFAKVRDDVAQSVAYEEAVDAASSAIADAPSPTIAVVEGYCIGGGCHLAMACDFRFASPNASFGIPAAKLSIVYGLNSTQRLLALVGLTRAKRILYSAERFGAPEAVEIGFADELADDPHEAARTFLTKLASNAPLSIAGAKLMLDRLAVGDGALDPADAKRVIDQASASEDYAEGRRAFADKREPRFLGR